MMMRKQRGPSLAVMCVVVEYIVPTVLAASCTASPFFWMFGEEGEERRQKFADQLRAFDFTTSSGLAQTYSLSSAVLLSNQFCNRLYYYNRPAYIIFCTYF
jgi:hypothetical protein